MNRAQILASALCALAGCTPEVTLGGPAPDGGAHDGALRDGALRDGALQDGAPRDGALGTSSDASAAADLAAPEDLALATSDGQVICSAQGPLDCTPGPGNGLTCFVPQQALFANQVNQAIEQVLAAHPDWFDYSTGFDCCPKAIQPDAYVDAVVQNVQAQNLCAIRDPNDGDEIVVKLHNDCAENYGVITSGLVVRHPPKYQGACAPAWF